MKKILISLIIVLVIISFYNITLAEKSEIYVFGEKPTADWIEKNLGKEFTYEIVNALRIEDKVFVLYRRKERIFKTYLSIFEKGKEELLWKYDENASVTRTVMLTGYLDKNELPDLLFCYSIDESGRYDEFWERQLILFPDSKETQKVEIPISYSDVICDDSEGKCQSKSGKAASIRESSDIVFPANEDGDILINIFSYFSNFNTYLERKGNIKTERIRYWIKGSNIKKEKDDNISALDIVGILYYTKGIYIY